MKRVVRLLLFLSIVILLYMLFLSIRQGMKGQSDKDITVIEQTDADTNS